MTTDLAQALNDAGHIIEDTQHLVRVVLSGSRRNMTTPAVRVDIRPILIKDKLLLQVSEFDGEATSAKNYEPRELKVAQLLESGYSNILVENTTGSLSIRVTKKNGALVRRENGERIQHLNHDQVKSRLLNAADPFLREVGIADSEGRIKPSRQDKYRQVEEFLRLLMPTLNNAIRAGHIHNPSDEMPLRIVDLGCGNAYLTFAAHQYLRSIQMPVQIVGIDVRPASLKRNREIAVKLGISSSIEFRAEEISHNTVDGADVVIALHACDTATDDAIAWAVNNSAKLILIAPCCHHDLQSQFVDSPNPWQVITRYGLLEERFADLLTDALRAHILKLVGYRSEVIEFVGGEHTPRNLMIRAVKTGANAEEIDFERYEDMVKLWNVTPALAQRLRIGSTQGRSGLGK
jgi:SAM-dependent methyltransferase